MRKLLISLALLASFAITACGTTKHMAAPGPLNGFSGDPMAMVGVGKNPLYGPWKSGDYELVSLFVNDCNNLAKKQQSGPIESIATGAGAYGIPAFAAAPTAISGFLGSTTGLPLEIGVLNTVNGGVYGGIAYSNGRVGFVGVCAAEFLKDGLAQARAPGVHVWVSTLRTRNTSDKVPAWASPPVAIPEAAQSRR